VCILVGMGLHRVNFHLTDQQRERLRRLSKLDGRSVAELIRIAIDAYLDKEERRKEKKR
jgi:predicted DNA-binding protein